MLPDTPRPDASRPGGEAPGYHVCFVCTGNICRSPMAESVFRARVAEDGLDGVVTVSSAGTGSWHEGAGADHRAVSVLEEAGYGSAHAARQFRAEWFAVTDLVIALDHGHERELRRLAPTAADAAKVRLLRSYDPAVTTAFGSGVDRASPELEVADPYFGTRSDFETVLAQVEAAVPALLAAVRAAVADAAGEPGVPEGAAQ